MSQVISKKWEPKVRPGLGMAIINKYLIFSELTLSRFHFKIIHTTIDVKKVDNP